MPTLSPGFLFNDDAVSGDIPSVSIAALRRNHFKYFVYRLHEKSAFSAPVAGQISSVRAKR
jgi:hypothetical protein